MKITKAILAALGVLGLATGLGNAAVTFNWATVGDAGNAADPLNSGSVPGIGSVATIYNIATKEVNISQYTEFLNAVAKTDINGLYNTNMASNANIAGITRTGSSGSYVYTAIAGSGNRPVTYVSWNDAARFVNWLHNGQGSGSTETGVYNMSLTTPTRSGSATYWIPSENEWYKAAYYDPSVSGPSDDYWLYPMRTDTAPYSDQPPGTTSPNSSFSGNFYSDDGVANGYNDGYAVSGSTSFPTGNALTDGGAYVNAASNYGTYDQGGNVFEWNDTVIAGDWRGLRGGSWGFNVNLLQSSGRFTNPPDDEYEDMGFRVASVPEPSTAVLMLLGGGAYWLMRRRKATPIRSLEGF